MSEVHVQKKGGEGCKRGRKCSIIFAACLNLVFCHFRIRILSFAVPLSYRTFALFFILLCCVALVSYTYFIPTFINYIYVLIFRNVFDTIITQ